jgi:hypothetical protein
VTAEAALQKTALAKRSGVGGVAGIASPRDVLFCLVCVWGCEGTGPSRSGIVAGAAADGERRATGGRTRWLWLVWRHGRGGRERGCRERGLESEDEGEDEGEGEGEGVKRMTLRCSLPAFHSGLFAVGTCRSMPRRCKHADAAVVTCRSGIGCMDLAALHGQGEGSGSG